MAAPSAVNGDLKQPEAPEAVDTSMEAAEAVEQDLVAKANKAGAVAYQFDPDAPPEEKAAVAEAVCPWIICARYVRALLTGCCR